MDNSVSADTIQSQDNLNTTTTSSKDSTMAFPPEIQEHILSFLLPFHVDSGNPDNDHDDDSGNDDPNGLQVLVTTCAVVRKHWLDYVRSALFKEICFEHEQRWALFEELLSQPFEDLELFLRKTQKLTVKKHKLFERKPEDWSAQAFLACSPHLVQLTTLCLGNVNWRGVRGHAFSGPMYGSATTLKLRRSAFLDVFQLHGLLAALPTLLHLDFDDIRFKYEPELEVSSNPNLALVNPRLSTLHFAGDFGVMYEIFELLAVSGMVDNLSEFISKSSFSPQDRAVEAELMYGFKNVLHSLENSPLEHLDCLLWDHSLFDGKCARTCVAPQHQTNSHTHPEHFLPWMHLKKLVLCIVDTSAGDIPRVLKRLLYGITSPDMEEIELFFQPPSGAQAATFEPMDISLFRHCDFILRRPQFQNMRSLMILDVNLTLPDPDPRIPVRSFPKRAGVAALGLLVSDPLELLTQEPLSELPVELPPGDQNDREKVRLVISTFTSVVTDIINDTVKRAFGRFSERGTLTLGMSFCYATI